MSGIGVPEGKVAGYDQPLGVPPQFSTEWADRQAGLTAIFLHPCIQ